MITNFYRVILPVVLGLVFNPLHASSLPVEAFASLPDVSDVKLSPNGQLVASLVRLDSKDKKGTAVSIFNLETGKKNYPIYADNTKYIITDIQWKDNQNIFIDTKFAASRNGVPTIETRLLNLDIETKKTQSVVPPSFTKRIGFVPQIQTNVIDYLKDDPNHVLMSLRGFEYSGEPSVVKVSMSRSGKTSIIKGAEKHIFDWMTDQQGRVRISTEIEDTTYRVNLHNQDDVHQWHKIWEFEAFSEQQIWPLGFSVDPKYLYVLALHEGKDAIFKVDLTDPKLAKSLVHFDKNYDVSGSLQRSKLTGEVIGIGSVYWDKKYQKLQAMLDKALPDTDNYILNLSDDENRYIALATSATEPGIYVYGDIKNKSLQAIAYRYEKLTPETLSEVKAVTYKARDGLEIEGFLTLPRDSGGKNLPTIIFPHGGPISFDSDGFDYWTQFLASRGYAVLQMNFRGSSGYGYDFMQMGLKNWGKAMQDDVEDGTRWLIDKGIANKDKICILGASYGGYAALMGAIKTPDLYQCSVSFAGVTNLRSLVISSRRYLNYEITKEQIGSDYDELWERSPLKHAQKINLPVLLIHGEKDRIVRVSQSEDMYEELEDADKQVEYIELERGDHYLSNNDNRLKAFKAIESFLKSHLK